MIRKCFVILLGLFYLGISTGFTLNLHYCLGRLNSVNFTDTSSCLCKTKGSHKCCKNSQVKVDLKQNFICPSYSLLHSDLGISVMNKPVSCTDPVFQPVYIRSFAGRAPPNLSPPSYYLLFHSFRI